MFFDKNELLYFFTFILFNMQSKNYFAYFLFLKLANILISTVISFIMSFNNEIANIFGDEYKNAEYALHCFGDKILVIEGYKRIISFSGVNISVRLNNNSIITIDGAKMVIKRLEKGELIISGDILSIKKQGALNG